MVLAFVSFQKRAAADCEKIESAPLAPIEVRKRFPVQPKKGQADEKVKAEGKTERRPFSPTESPNSCQSLDKDQQ